MGVDPLRGAIQNGCYNHYGIPCAQFRTFWHFPDPEFRTLVVPLPKKTTISQPERPKAAKDEATARVSNYGLLGKHRFAQGLPCKESYVFSIFIPTTLVVHIVWA